MSRKQKKILYRIIAALMLSVLVYIIPIGGICKLLLFLIPYLIAGYDIILKALKNIINGQVFDENFLMSVATIGAFCIGEYTEAAAVMLFYQTGELFQSIAVNKSRKSIAALMDIKPETATVLRDGREETVSPEEVGLGEILIIKAGERIPLDGVITDGFTSVDTSSLTGESMPSELKVGDKVISGTVNLSGLIKIQVSSLYNDSTVAKILELTENAAEKKAVTESFITRFARYYTPIVVVSAVLLGVVPPLFVGDWSSWIERALIFLVVSCPCALVVSVPLTFFGGIGGASKRGILFKGAGCMERLSVADTFVFDKTGTLTEGKFTVDKITAKNISEEELLIIAASAEKGSNHPIAQSLLSAVETDKIISAESVTEVAGKGIEAVLRGEKYYIGNAELMKVAEVETGLQSPDGTCIYVAKQGLYLGCISVKDKIKSDSSSAIKELKRLKIKNTVMLTGDNSVTAEKIAKEVGTDKVYAELLPNDKVIMIEKILSEGHSAAFAGDGINDAPVLTRADVGIAMGAYGSDAAIEAADVVIMDDKPSKIAEALRISRKTMAIVKQNIIFALAVKGIILVLGALGFANMWIAVFGDVGVTVIAILNAMRTLYIKY